MKILYIDIASDGHHLEYLQSLITDKSIVLLPRKVKNIKCKVIEDNSGYCKERNLRNYLRWIREISNIVKDQNIEEVHFLSGDALYRFFGIFLWKIKKPIIVTCHNVQFSSARNISLKNICRHIDYCVVHTEYLLKKINDIGIKNVIKIEYPNFHEKLDISKEEARKYFGLPERIKILAVLGTVSRYKGLDILLQALNNVKEPFYLLIAGKAKYLNEENIKKMISNYSDKVKLYLNFLSKEEFAMATIAADIIVLPYRKEFFGASGPMIEGITYKKYILGTSHGSMGDIIEKYSLGSTFKSEDIEDLSKAINNALKEDFKWSDNAEKFRKMINLNTFISEYNKLYKLMKE